MLEDGQEMIPEHIMYEKSIPRENKLNKKIVCSEIADCDINIYANLTQYEYLIGIDTNTKQTEYGNYSASGVVISKIIDSKTYVELIQFSTISCMVPRFYREQSRELVGLFMLIRSLVNNTLINYSLTKGILIIIDHNLDKIDMYNDRIIPIIPGNESSYLPPKISIMYASADKKNDSIFNQIIKECDKVATKTIDDLVEQERIWDKTT